MLFKYFYLPLFVWHTIKYNVLINAREITFITNKTIYIFGNLDGAFRSDRLLITINTTIIRWSDFN